jgi:hypothetical protein
MTILLLAAGLVLLIVGAEARVRGASSLAGKAGIAPLTIGRTVVAFGTSAPELAVSIGSSLAGRRSMRKVRGNRKTDPVHILLHCLHFPNWGGFSYKKVGSSPRY